MDTQENHLDKRGSHVPLPDSPLVTRGQQHDASTNNQMARLSSIAEGLHCARGVPGAGCTDIIKGR